MKWIVRIVQALLSVGFLMAGLSKVFSSAAQLEELFTEPLGYGAGFMYLIGALETAAALGLLAGYRRRAAVLAAAALLTIIMTAAIISSLAAGMAADITLPVVYLALLLFLIFAKMKETRTGAGGVGQAARA